MQQQFVTEKVIQRLAVKANLTIRCYEARITDKEASRKTNSDHGAKDGTASVRKSIISRDVLKPLTDIRNAARNYHKEMTSPWGPKNERILSAGLVQEYKSQMRVFEQEYEMVYNVFRADYPAIIAQEASNLGAFYKQDDYAALQELDTKFEFISLITPLECADDFRVEIMESVLDEIKQDVIEQEKANQVAVTEDLYNRLHFVIKDMIERISATKIDPDTNEEIPKIFHKTAITSVQKLLDLLPKLNVNQDQELNKLRDEVANRFEDLTADDIKDNDHVRAKTIAEGETLLDEIENKMGGLYNLPETADKEAA
jgi:hypothetical protein